MTLNEQKERTRRLDAAVDDMNVLLSFYPESEHGPIFWCIRKAKEELWKAKEHSEFEEPLISTTEAAKRSLAIVSHILGNSVTR